MSDECDEWAVMDLGSGLEAPRMARAFTREKVAGWGCSEMVDMAELCVDELVVNAILHGHSACRLELHRTRDHVIELVHDMGSGEPRALQVGLEATGGRGLMLVESFSSAWGWRPEATGKVVWCELDCIGQAA